MKKLFTFIMFSIILIYCNQANAKIRRVGYFGTPVAGTDYTSLQSAHDSANVKDTILLFPGSWNANISKKLVLLGYGYFVSGTGSNANLQNITGALSVSITLKSGADSCIYEGIDGLNITVDYGAIVNKVIVRRCNVGVYFNDMILDSWQIVQCNIYLQYYYSGKVTNIKLNNCVGSINFSIGNPDQNGQLNNNIFSDSYLGGNFVIKNSIFLANHSQDVNCVYQNCIAYSTFPLPPGNGNKTITYAGIRDSVFVGYSDQGTYSNDGRWVLKPGSLAKGAGTGGTDCGIFGGSNPYKLSGIPKIPSLYKLSATSNVTSTNPYKITFSVRSNN